MTSQVYGDRAGDDSKMLRESRCENLWTVGALVEMVADPFSA